MIISNYIIFIISVFLGGKISVRGLVEVGLGGIGVGWGVG